MTVVEILYPGQPWQIVLPSEDAALLDRTLEARGPDGELRARWRYGGTQMMSGWECVEGTEPNPNAPCVGVVSSFLDLFEEIVAGCIKYGWTLWSMPPIQGDTSEHTPGPAAERPAPAGRQVRLTPRRTYRSG